MLVGAHCAIYDPCSLSRCRHRARRRRRRRSRRRGVVVMIPGVEPLFARFLFVLDRRFPRSFNNDHRWFIDNATKSGPPQHQIPR